MNILEYQKNLSLSKIKPINLVYVEEEYLVSNFMEKLSKMAPVRILYGSELNLQDFINALGEVGLFEKKTEKEIFFVKEAQALLKRMKDPKVIRNLFNRLKTKAVFLLIEEKLDKTALQKEPYKTILELGDYLEAKKLSREKIKDLVKKKVEEAGKKIDQDALDYLLEIASYNLTFLRGEVKKLLLYADKRITLEDVKKVCLVLTEHNIFDFLGAFFNKDVEKALLILSSLYREGEPALKIQAVLVSYALKLLVLKKSKEEPDKVLGKLGVRNPFMVNNLKMYAQNFSERELENLLERLYWLDFYEKVYFAIPEQALKNMVVDFLTQTRQLG